MSLESEILDSLTTVVGRRNLINEENINYVYGTVDGGPNSDGLYPQTDPSGNVSLEPCRAKVIQGIIDAGGFTLSGFNALPEATEAEVASVAPEIAGLVIDATTGLPTLKHFSLSLVGTGGGGTTPPDPDRIAIAGLRTSANLGLRLSPVTPAAMSYRPNPVADRIVDIDSRTTYQSFLGVGAALTEAACFNLMTRLDLSQRTAILTEWLVTNGQSVVRVALGPNDYSANMPAIRAGTDTFHTYDDSGTTDGSGFDFSPALTYVIPILQLVKSLKDDVFFVGSIWSGPVAYKSTGAHITTGTMNESSGNLIAYARNYVVKALQGFASHGVPIDYLCIQNEPGRLGLGDDVADPFPACQWTVSGYVAALGHVGAEIAAASSPALATKLMAGDDSVSTAYVSAAFADDDAAPYLFAASVHGYNESLYNFVHHLGGAEAFFWLMMEISAYSDDPSLAAAYFMSGIFMATLRAGGSGLCVWNFMLDPAGQPGISTALTPMVTVSNTGALTRRVDYYLLSQISRLVKRGALRVDSTSFAQSTEYTSVGSDIETVAFKNPDGSIAVLVWNGSTTAKTVYLRDVVGGGVGTTISIPARTFDCYRFRNTAAANKPDAPKVGATFNSGVVSVYLKKDAPCDNGAAISGYDIYVGAQAGYTATRVASNATLPHSYSPPTITTPYAYVEAVNSAGPSANSNEVAATSTDTTVLGRVQEAGASGDSSTVPSISLAAPADGGNTVVIIYTGDINLEGPAQARKIVTVNDANGVFFCAWTMPAYILAGGTTFTPIGGTPFGWTMSAQEYKNFSDAVLSTHGIAHLFANIAYWQTAQPRPENHDSVIAVGWGSGGTGVATGQINGGSQTTSGLVTIASGAGGEFSGSHYHAGIVFRKNNAMGGEDYVNITGEVNFADCGYIEILIT